MENIVDKWGFKKEKLETFIKQGNDMISNECLNKNEIRHIKKEILTLQNFLNKIYLTEIKDVSRKKSFAELKDSFLNELMWLYYNLDEKLIDWLIELSETEIFNQNYFLKDNKVSVEKQLEYTLKNYEINSPMLLPYAKDFVFNHPNNIQIVKDPKIASFCEYFKIMNQSLLIINPEETGYVLNHEIQHFIERQFDFPKNDFYLELSSIYFELLFTDILYEKEGILIQGKIKGMDFDLALVYEYLIAVREFSKYNFNVSSEKFKQIFLEKIYIIPEELETYLEKQLKHDNVANTLIYTLSLLKAIELRSITLTSKLDSFDIIKPFLSNKKLIFNPSKNLFKIYENYVDEIKQKSLKK